MIPARPEDQVAFGVTYYDVDTGLTRTEQLRTRKGLTLANGARGVQQHGMVYELNYNIKVRDGLELQPEIEFFRHPGAQRNVPDALLLTRGNGADQI